MISKNCHFLKYIYFFITVSKKRTTLTENLGAYTKPDIHCIAQYKKKRSCTIKNKSPFLHLIYLNSR